MIRKIKQILGSFFSPIKTGTGTWHYSFTLQHEMFLMRTNTGRASYTSTLNWGGARMSTWRRSRVASIGAFQARAGWGQTKRQDVWTTTGSRPASNMRVTAPTTRGGSPPSEEQSGQSSSQATHWNKNQSEKKEMKKNAWTARLNPGTVEFRSTFSEFGTDLSIMG